MSSAEGNTRTWDEWTRAEKDPAEDQATASAIVKSYARLLFSVRAQDWSDVSQALQTDGANLVRVTEFHALIRPELSRREIELPASLELPVRLPEKATPAAELPQLLTLASRPLVSVGEELAVHLEPRYDVRLVYAMVTPPAPGHQPVALNKLAKNCHTLEKEAIARKEARLPSTGGPTQVTFWPFLHSGSPGAPEVAVWEGLVVQYDWRKIEGFPRDAMVVFKVNGKVTLPAVKLILALEKGSNVESRLDEMEIEGVYERKVAIRTHTSDLALKPAALEDERWQGLLLLRVPGLSA